MFSGLWRCTAFKKILTIFWEWVSLPAETRGQTSRWWLWQVCEISFHNCSEALLKVESKSSDDRTLDSVVYFDYDKQKPVHQVVPKHALQPSNIVSYNSPLQPISPTTNPTTLRMNTFNTLQDPLKLTGQRLEQARHPLDTTRYHYNKLNKTRKN